MLRAEGIRMLVSFADSRVPCVGYILSSVGHVGWFTTICLKIAEQRLFYICISFRMRELYRHKSYNELVVIGATAIYIEVCSRISR